LAFLLALRRRGVPVRPYKKGPDYIDPAWLGWAAGRQARNLDTYLMGRELAAASFGRTAGGNEINLIEGARGIFDGFDTAGTHSTAELAKLLDAPVILALNATKMTRTAAAVVFGCQKFDPALNICGVILDRVNGKRHEHILRGSIEQNCGVPVIGVVPKIHEDELVLERHLGLITPEDHGAPELLERTLFDKVIPGLDVEKLIAIARSAPPLNVPRVETPELPDGSGLRIGVLRDAAFTFYYAENLEELERSGAELVFISALSDAHVPAGIHALYMGGGFPETHAEELTANREFHNSVRAAVEAGLPVYAECGGLMYLSRAIRWQESRFDMAGVLPFEVDVSTTAQGHGYAELSVDEPNPFFPVGTHLRGHEFHYSRMLVQEQPPVTACSVLRGSGCWRGRDAVITRNVWASYTHLHALATPEWAPGLISAARRFALAHDSESSTAGR